VATATAAAQEANKDEQGAGAGEPPPHLLDMWAVGPLKTNPSGRRRKRPQKDTEQ